jgi:acyl-CoA dehydrogenase
MIEESSWMNEELRIYRSTVRRFIENEFIPNQARWRQQQYPDIDAWTKAGKVGILLCDVPEEYGGSGGTFAHAAVIVEEIARVGVHFGAYTHNSMAQYIVAYATEEQKRNWLPRMARGELVGAIAFTEPAAGSDITAIKTTARREGDQYVINGS